MVAQFKTPQSDAAVTAEFVTITPPMAKAWLALNVANYRPLKPRRVKSLAEDIKNGRWQENGESIKFDVEGNLIDGQHRLSACVSSNAPFRSLVVRGVRDDVAIDRGRPRNLSDTLRRRGEKEYTALATALRWLHAYEKDRLRSVIGDASPATDQELLLVLERHPGIRESVSGGRVAKQLLRHSMAVGFHYIATLRSSKETADIFFEKLVKGADLTPVDPIYHFRERLLKNMGAKAKLPRHEICALFIKAWNAWIHERPVNNLRWRASGPRPEEFPSFE